MHTSPDRKALLFSPGCLNRDKAACYAKTDPFFSRTNFGLDTLVRSFVKVRLNIPRAPQAVACPQGRAGAPPRASRRREPPRRPAPHRAAPARRTRSTSRRTRPTSCPWPTSASSSSGRWGRWTCTTAWTRASRSTRRKPGSSAPREAQASPPDAPTSRAPIRSASLRAALRPAYPRRRARRAPQRDDRLGPAVGGPPADHRGELHLPQPPLQPVAGAGAAGVEAHRRGERGNGGLCLALRRCTTDRASSCDLLTTRAA